MKQVIIDMTSVFDCTKLCVHKNIVTLFCEIAALFFRTDSIKA